MVCGKASSLRVGIFDSATMLPHLRRVRRPRRTGGSAFPKPPTYRRIRKPLVYVYRGGSCPSRRIRTTPTTRNPGPPHVLCGSPGFYYRTFYGLFFLLFCLSPSIFIKGPVQCPLGNGGNCQQGDELQHRQPQPHTSQRILTLPPEQYHHHAAG